MTAKEWSPVEMAVCMGTDAMRHCPHCFESSGYVWEHGNDWESGPWSHQTNIPCRFCNGTGLVQDSNYPLFVSLRGEVR